MTNRNADFLPEEDLRSLPFLALGHDVKIHERAIIMGIENISLGSNVRIDADCSLLASAGLISIGSYVHLGQGCYLSGAGGISIEDFAGLSQQVNLYSASDDYSGGGLANATIPAEYLNLQVAPVVVKRHGLIGAKSVVLPGATVSEGTAVGALSVVRGMTCSWAIYSGNPAKVVAPRRKDEILRREAALLGTIEN